MRTIFRKRFTMQSSQIDKPSAPRHCSDYGTQPRQNECEETRGPPQKDRTSRPRQEKQKSSEVKLSFAMGCVCAQLPLPSLCRTREFISRTNLKELFFTRLSRSIRSVSNVGPFSIRMFT